MRRGFWNIEHYRPKAGYKQNGAEKLQTPGYYWLAYDWENLLLSCERCNREYKKNLFPLSDPAKRAINHHADLAEEEPLLLDPTVTDPQQFIGFRAEIPYAIGGNVYGDTTIRLLELDREDLNERRREKLAEYEVLSDLISLSETQPDNMELKQIAEDAKKLLAQVVLASAEYTAMTMAHVQRVQQ